MASTVVNVVTANIGRKRSASYRAQAINKVRDSFPKHAPLIGWQEIDEGDSGDEHHALNVHMPYYDWSGFQERVPLGVPPHWEIDRRTKTRGHGGLRGVTPHREIVEVMAHSREDPWAQLVIINSHVVAGAHTNPGQAYERKRDELWHQWWQAMRERVEQNTKRGNTVLVTMDANHPNLPRIHPREQRLVHSRLDYILAIEPKNPRVTVKKLGVNHIPLGIDGHKAHGVRLRVTEVSR